MRLLILNLTRKKLRTFLTVFGLAVALFLFCFLEAVLYAFNAGVAMADASRLVVQHKEAITFTLPQAYRQWVAQVKGVNKVASMTWFGGLYKEPTKKDQREQFFGQFGVEFEEFLEIYPEVVIPPEQLRALLQDQTGCVLGSAIAERLGKKVGDRFSLRSTIWPRPEGSNWIFNVRAIYTSKSPTYDLSNMFFHSKYLDEGRQFGKNTSGIFVVQLNDPNVYQSVSAAIDERFKNSPYETRTMSEKAFNMQFVSMMGNLKLLLRSIGTVVVLTMLLITANTMMMAARERTREMGILKSIGFTDGYVFFLLIGEALLIALLGTIMGAGGTYLLINVLGFNPKPDFFPIFYVPLNALLIAGVIAGVTGGLSGLIPAFQGMRLKATDALRAM